MNGLCPHHHVGYGEPRWAVVLQVGDKAKGLVSAMGRVIGSWEVWSALLGVACVISGCSQPQSKEPARSAADQELTGTQTLSLSLPSGAALNDVAVGANGSLAVSDRTKLVTRSGLRAALSNVGSTSTNIGADTDVGSLYSQADVMLRERARVDGFVRTAGTVAEQNAVVITGGRQEHATLAPINNLIWKVTLPPAGSSFSVEPDQRWTIPPGSYGDVSVKSRAHLALSSGTYFFSSLNNEPQAVFELDTRSAPIIVYSTGGFTFKGSNAFQGDDASVLWVSLATSQVAVESAFTGTIIAPNGSIRLAPLAGPSYRGTFFARDLLIEAGDQVTLDPFKHWELIFPVKPIIECTNQFDQTRLNAVVGYDNPLDIPITVPLGANNQVVPSLGDPPTTFEPGIHHNVAVIPFTAPSLTWSLFQISVTASSSTPQCSLAQLSQALPPAHTGLASESAGPPSAPAEARIVGNIGGPGRSTRALPERFGVTQSQDLASRDPSAHGKLGAVQQAAGLPTGTFKVTIGSMNIGNDAACWGGDPIVTVIVNGKQIGHEVIPTDCGFISACATLYFPNFVFEAPDISATDEDVQVRVILDDQDTRLCGCDVLGDSPCTQREIDSTLTVSNLGTAFKHLEHDGWQLGITIEGNGRPRACMNWKGEYLDAVNADRSSASDDYLTSPTPAQYPASGAIAEVTIKNGPLSQTYTGPLDKDGCVPPEFSPDISLWTLAPSDGPTGLTATMRWSSEFCVDPTGNGCIDPSDGKRSAGGRVIVSHAAAQGTPVTSCVVLTQDPSLTDPDCQVVHSNEGAFAAFKDGLPPAKVGVGSGNEDDVTRISAIVSNLYRREAETGGELGLSTGLVAQHRGNGSPLISIVADGLCDLGHGIFDSCSQGSTIFYRPDQCCSIDNFSHCRDVPPEGCSVDKDNNKEHRLLGDSYWKYVVAHEIGHQIQDRLWGTGNFEYGDGPGIPGETAKCSCTHVSSSNQLHCLQSAELPDAAQIEGFAQYFASRAYNRDEDSTCTFRYYKEFLDNSCRVGVPLACSIRTDGLTLNLPPVPFDCRTPFRWRNNNCLTGSAPSTSAVAALGTEIDWMGFYLAWVTSGANRSTTLDMANSYLTACGGVCKPDTFDKDRNLIRGTNVPFVTLVTGAKAALSSVKFQAFVQASMTFGVSTDVTP